jgi:hypothetical protein
MKRLPKKYAEGLGWIARNDDTTWLNDEQPIPSVTLVLLADLFGIDQDQAIKQLRGVVAALELGR